MRLLTRLLLILALLGAAAFTGWRWAKIRDYPIGAGEWVDSPGGRHYAALYQVQHRPFWGGFRREWRIEVGDGSITRPERIWLDERVRAADLPERLSAGEFIRWESPDVVVFALRNGEKRVQAGK